MGIFQRTIYMVPKITLVTDDGLISVFNRSLAGATGIGRGGGAASRGPGFGWTSPDREIKSESQRCERIARVCVRARIYAYMHTCVRTHTCVCVRERVLASERI